MDNYERINQLKSLIYISNQDNIEYSDLFLKDENGETLLEHIVKKNITIYKNKLLEEISNNYEMLYYMITNNYFLDKYYNIDLLFQRRDGKSLIEIIFEKSYYNMPSESIYRLFEKESGTYMFERLLAVNENNACKLIENINNFDTLYNCLKEIGKLSLMKHATEYCFMQQTPNNVTMLEELIEMNVNLSDVTDEKSYRIAEILYINNDYLSLLNMDCEILMNYPSPSDNYIQRLIQKYQNGENIPFSKFTPKSNDNKTVAEVNILLLRNNIEYRKPGYYSIIHSFNLENNKPILLHMLDIDKNLVLQNFNLNDLLENLRKYIASSKSIEKDKLENLNIDELLALLPQFRQFEEDLLSGKITKIEKETYYADALLQPMQNGITPLEYALKNNIPLYTKYNLPLKEAVLYIKYKKNIDYLKEKTLYEEVSPGKKLIDLLIENERISVIKNTCKKDLQIMDYCIKYNRFDFISQDILNELFVISNGHFLAEKYLNNPAFITAISSFKLPKKTSLLIYQMGYKNILISACEDILLTKTNNGTILDDLLSSNISPNFYQYDFESIETLNILLAHNRPDLLYNAKLSLLMDYPSKDNNYLQYLIECYKNGINVHFEKRTFKCDDKELMARCYIQMTKNGLNGFLDTLKENDLLDKVNNKPNLLYYLISIDSDLTINKILSLNLKKNPNIFTELKILGISETMLNLSYDKFNCSEIIRNAYNREYAEEIISPVEDLLEELRLLFQNDGKSNMEFIDALITSYRYSTSINPIFIEELKTMIKIKKANPNFYYIHEIDGGFFSKHKGIVVEDSTISVLNHETGHAIHCFVSDYEVPENYHDLITSIVSDPTWLNKIAEYSSKFHEIKKQVYERATMIVDSYINASVADEEASKISEMLETEKEKFIQQYLDKGYTRETLDVVLSSSFTKEEFLNQKRKIEIEEVVDFIMRSEYDAFIAIGDIIDAISDGKFRSRLLHDDENNIIPSAYGHGVRYYYDDNPNELLRIRFTEMIANYSSIIKSKHANEIIEVLQNIVGNEFVTMLDDFYKKRLINAVEYDYESEKTR